MCCLPHALPRGWGGGGWDRRWGASTRPGKVPGGRGNRWRKEASHPHALALPSPLPGCIPWSVLTSPPGAQGQVRRMRGPKGPQRAPHLKQEDEVRALPGTWGPSFLLSDAQGPSVGPDPSICGLDLDSRISSLPSAFLLPCPGPSAAVRDRSQTISDRSLPVALTRALGPSRPLQEPQAGPAGCHHKNNFASVRQIKARYCQQPESCVKNNKSAMTAT